MQDRSAGSREFIIPRKVLRSLDEIIIISEENEIGRRQIDPIWATQEDLIVRDNLAAGEQLATSPLTYAPEGGKVKIVTLETKVQSAQSMDSDDVAKEG